MAVTSMLMIHKLETFQNCWTSTDWQARQAQGTTLEVWPAKTHTHKIQQMRFSPASTALI